MYGGILEKSHLKVAFFDKSTFARVEKDIQDFFTLGTGAEMHTIQRLLTIVKSGSIYTLLDRYNYLYFYILNAFYFTFILTLFFHFLQQRTIPH